VVCGGRKLGCRPPISRSRVVRPQDYNHYKLSFSFSGSQKCQGVSTAGKDFLLPLLLGAATNTAKGVTGQTHSKADTSWQRWIEFLVKANFLGAVGQGDPYLGALDQSETHRTLGAFFAHSVRMRHYSKSTKGHAELVASTCRTAVDGVATAFIAADKPDPRLDSDGKTSLLLLRQFKGYKNNNPGKQSQQCLPFSLLKKMLERPIAHLAILIVFHQLMLLGFFFAIRSCENFKVSGE